MEDRAIYKQVKINWWVVIIFGGIHVWMIFAYIHQWGNNPMDKAGLIVMSIIWIFCYIFIGRSKVIIDDNQVVFRSDVWIPIKIPIVNIKNVSVKQISWMNLYIPEKNTEKFYFGFVKQAISIHLKNGKTHQIGVKDVEKIKEEIEKRMNKISNHEIRRNQSLI